MRTDPYLLRTVFISLPLFGFEVIWIAFGDQYFWLDYVFWPFYVLSVAWMACLMAKGEPPWSNLMDEIEVPKGVSVIKPVKVEGIWKYTGADGLQHSLIADDSLDLAAELFLGRKTDFVILFSESPFPGNQIVLERHNEVYTVLTPGILEGKECRLCSTLESHFQGAPKYLYAQLR